MIKLFLHDAFCFDYLGEIGKVDYIFSSPPFFNPKGLKNFGKDGLKHIQYLRDFFIKLHKTLKSSKTVVHLSLYSFLIFQGKKEKTIKDMPVALSLLGSSDWYHLSLSSVSYIMGREFFINNKRGKKILDPFCGSGTILKEAERLGFDCFGVDNDKNQLELSGLPFLL